MPVRILYLGSYEYHEIARTPNGTIVSYVNQNLEWNWTATGGVPVAFNGSRLYGVENLPGKLGLAARLCPAASSSTTSASPTPAYVCERSAILASSR